MRLMSEEIGTQDEVSFTKFSATSDEYNSHELKGWTHPKTLSREHCAKFCILVPDI